VVPLADAAGVHEYLRGGGRRRHVLALATALHQPARQGGSRREWRLYPRPCEQPGCLQ
jgi:hypothetical protein